MRIVFFGTPGFAAVSLSALLESTHEVVTVVAQPDRKAGRGMKTHRPETVVLAEEHEIETLQPKRIREDEFLQRVKELRPDIGVVVAYGRILPESLLAIPKHGFLNVHASILPFYRGAAPIQRAIENGDFETGVSIMKVDAELDHGPVFEIERTPIDPKERTPQLFERLATIGGVALVRVLNAIEGNSATATEQDHDKATLAPKIEKSEGLINWSIPALTIYNRFRAFDPWPGVSVMVGEERVRLIDMTPVSSPDAAPGTLIDLDEDALIIATVEGSLRISSVQRSGRNRITGAEYARSRGLEKGSKLA